ncbi:hypothetical protein O3M35_010137 [Rhynocoris fuscipes]|uniref:Engrailed n=1 Tax=Rhynocoris fuscipes TaxID=488301 RepID=A0AAW1CY57_9HEMI
MAALESARRSPDLPRRTSAFHRIELLTRPERCSPPSSSPILSISPTITPPSSTTASPPRHSKDSPPSSLRHHHLHHHHHHPLSPSSSQSSPPPPTSASSTGQTPPSLSFSVDNILRPEFGKTAARRASPALINVVSPSSPPIQQLPICLNTTTNTTTGSIAPGAGGGGGGPPRKGPDDVPSPTKIDPVIPDDPNGPVWPAWVYCTRYSDRPSSGKFIKTKIISAFTPLLSPYLLITINRQIHLTVKKNLLKKFALF